MPRTGPGWFTVTSSRPTSWWTSAPAGLRTCTCPTSGSARGAMSSAGMTASGVFLGAPDYAAPEQIQGLAVDGRAEPYALACVAYQLLIGGPPFRRDRGRAGRVPPLPGPAPA